MTYLIAGVIISPRQAHLSFDAKIIGDNQKPSVELPRRIVYNQRTAGGFEVARGAPDYVSAGARLRPGLFPYGHGLKSQPSRFQKERWL